MHVISNSLISAEFILFSYLDFLDFKDEWKKKLMEVAKKVLDSLKITSETLRAEVMKAIEAGKVKLTDLKRRMLEILASLRTKEQDTIDDRK